MIKEFIDKWQKDKDKLEEYLRTTPQSEYSTYRALLEKTIELVLNGECGDEFSDLDIKRITEIDDGDYQGTLVYMIPKCKYQPSADDYVVTYVWYGSCSGCDTLLSISSYKDGLPTKSQVNKYMLLCLHMIERMKYVYDENEVFDFL